MAWKYVSLSSPPKRAEFRVAIKVLKALAFVYPDAKDELAAVKALQRAMFPTEQGAGRDPMAREQRKAETRRRRAKQALAHDCLGTCPTCNGSGSWVYRTAVHLEQRGPAVQPQPVARTARKIAPSTTTAYTPVSWDAWPVTDHWRLFAFPGWAQTATTTDRGDCDQIVTTIGVEHLRACPKCAGRGQTALAVAEQIDESDDRPYKAKIRLRGEFAHQQFDGTPGRRLPAVPHTRGYCGGSFLERSLRPEMVEELYGTPWRTRNSLMNPAACDTADMSAALEGNAAARLVAFAGKKPRHPKKQGSGRDKQNLTPGQERRAKQERRVARWNADERKRNPGERKVSRSRTDFIVRFMKKHGIDFDLEAYLADGRAEQQVEDRATVEAQRRGDLPADLLPASEPFRPAIVSWWRTVKPGDTLVLNGKRAIVTEPDESKEAQESPLYPFGRNGSRAVVQWADTGRHAVIRLDAVTTTAYVD